METIDQRLAKADRLTAITQKIGFALWQLQELDGVAATCFILLAKAKKEMGLDAGIALVEKAQSKTFGVTVHQMVKAGLLSSELEARFLNLLSERNWLVHNSRASSRSAVHSDAATQNLVLRVDMIAEESLALMKKLLVLAEGHIKRHGVSAQNIDVEAQKLLDQWHASDEI